MVINIIISIGKIEKVFVTTNNFIEKSAKIASNMCPAVKLAASLIPNATGLEKLLANSIITSNGDIPNGEPEGIKLLKKSSWCLPNPINITVNHTIKANPKVIDIWVVGVKVYIKNP